jgi:hypothetical protein
MSKMVDPDSLQIILVARTAAATNDAAGPSQMVLVTVMLHFPPCEFGV